MNVLWIDSGAKGGFFAFEVISAPSASDIRTGPWKGLRIKVIKWFHRIMERFDHSERLFTQLGYARQVNLIHSTQHTGEEIRKRLLRMARAAQGKHTSWLVVDTLLACLGGILTPLPGPNIFFFYPAIRTFSHYLARKGTLKVQGKIIFHFETDDLIDQLEIGFVRGITPKKDVLLALEANYNLKNLEGCLEGHH
jgi:hypothetical protein